MIRPLLDMDRRVMSRWPFGDRRCLLGSWIDDFGSLFVRIINLLVSFRNYSKAYFYRRFWALSESFDLLVRDVAVDHYLK
jgi:hypothetical protein